MSLRECSLLLEIFYVDPFYFILMLSLLYSPASSYSQSKSTFYSYAMGLYTTSSCHERFLEVSAWDMSRIFFLHFMEWRPYLWVWKKGHKLFSICVEEVVIFLIFLLNFHYKNQISCVNQFLNLLYFLKCVCLLPEFLFHHPAIFYRFHLGRGRAHPNNLDFFQFLCFVSFVAVAEKGHSNSTSLGFTLCICYLLLPCALFG